MRGVLTSWRRAAWFTMPAVRNSCRTKPYSNAICRYELEFSVFSSPGCGMVGDFESFKADLSLSKVEICRALYRQNAGHIRIRKEHVAVPNLVRIVESTLRLARVKGFHAMSLRDLSADSGMSIGGLYAYIRNKDDLVHLIQMHGMLLTRRTLHDYTEGVD